MSDINETANPFLKPSQPDPGTTGVSPFLPIQEPAYGQSFNPNSLAEPEEVARQRYLSAMIEAAPDKDYEAGRQRMAATVHALYPELSFDQVYQNPFPVVAQLTGYDFRNGGQPEDVLSILKEKMQGVADNFQRNMVAMDVGDLSWEQRNAGTDTEKLKLQTQIDAQKERLKYWPFDRWGAPGTQGGIIDQVLGVGDSSLKFSTDFVAGIVHDVGKPVVTAFNAQDIQKMGDLAKVTTRPKGGTDDPLSILTSPHTEVGPDGNPVTVQGRPLQAFLLWGIKNTPLVGTGYARMAGSSYSEMIDAGVDPGTANVLSDTVAKAGAAANLVSFGLLGNVVSKGVSRLVAGDVLDNAVFTGVKKYLMSGQNLNELAKSGMVKLETTQGGRLIKAVGQTAANSAEMGLVNGGLVAAQDIAFNASVELTNGLIKAKGESEARSKGITDEYEINKYVNDNAPRLAAPFKDVIGDFTKTFVDTLVGMAALGGVSEIAGGRLSANKPSAEGQVEIAKPSEVPVFNPATDKIEVAQTKATVHVGDTTTEIPITRENGAIHVTGDVAPEIAPHLAQKLADASEGQRIEAESPALRDAVELLNPDAPVIRDRISQLETQVANLESDKVPAGQIDPVRVELQAARDQLVTPTEAWKAPRPEQMTPQEFSVHQQTVMAERAGLGDTIPEQILKAAPNVTEPQAKSIGDLVARMELNTGQKLVNSIIHDDGLTANGAANQAERVIRLGKDANFDTVFHEVAHLARTLLTEDQHRTLVDELKLDTEADGFTLTRAGEESFAEHARTYVQNKENASPLLETIKKFIRDIVQAIAPRLSDKAMKTFDSLFGESDTSLHDQSGKMGPNGRLESGGRAVPESGLPPERGAGSVAPVDRVGEQGGTPLADQTTAQGAFPGELLQKSGVSEHERLIQKALAEGKYVPDHVIEAYLEKPWALEEWNKRHPESQRALEKDALTSESAEEFVTRVTDPLYPSDNIPESIKGLAGEDLKTELTNYWERTTKKDSAVEFKNTLKSFSPEEVTVAYRDALVQGSRREGALKTQLGQAQKRAEFNARMETEARVKIKGLEEALTSARAEAKANNKERVKSLENALSDARAEHELTLRHLADARRERDTMEKLARSIMRPVGTKTIDVHSQAFLKAIQNSIDPRFRRESTLARRTDAKKNFDAYLKMIEDDGFLGTGFKNKESLERIAGMAEKKSLDQFTLQELADLADVFNTAYDHGKAVLEAKEKQRAQDAFDSIYGNKDKGIKGLVNVAHKANPRNKFAALFGKDLERAKAGSIPEFIRAHNLDPQRMIDFLGGGKAEFNTEWHKEFIRAVNEAEDARLRDDFAFENEVGQALKDNGFTTAVTGRGSVHDLNNEVEVRGQKIPLQQAMHIYLAWMNERSRAVLIGDGERTGNRIDQAWHDDVVAAMDTVPGARGMADWILKWFNDPAKKAEIADLMANETNQNFVDEDNYTPIRRILRYLRTLDEVAADFAGRNATVMGKLNTSSTKERIDIAAEHQSAMDLGIIDALFEYQNYMSRYKAFLPTLNHLNRIMNDPGFRETVLEIGGKPTLDMMEHYLRSVANPNLDKSPGAMAKLMRSAMNNTAFAMLGANARSAVMQLPAFLLYAGQLKNPMRLFGAMIEMNANWTGNWQRIQEMSPQFRDRLQSPLAREVVNGTHDNYLKLAKDQSMKPISVIDYIAAGWGWWAKFTEERDGGATEYEAARLADEAMLRTQQTSQTKDEALWYGKSDTLKFYNMFQGPAHKTWLQLTYDLPRNPNWGHKISMAAGIMTSGVVMWIIANGHAPQDEKEWAQATLGQGVLSNFPLIGQDFTNVLSGYQSRGRLTPFEGGSQSIMSLPHLFSNETNGREKTPEERFSEWGTALYTATAFYYGLPLVEPKRVAGMVVDAAKGKDVNVVSGLMGWKE